MKSQIKAALKATFFVALPFVLLGLFYLFPSTMFSVFTLAAIGTIWLMAYAAFRSLSSKKTNLND